MRAAFSLPDWMAGLDVLEPLEEEGLQVFGVRHSIPAGPRYLTLDEALESDLIEITEVSQSGEVPTLHVENHSDSRVFLMAGEELVGAKQNRVLNVSIMVGAGSGLDVPVSCVEAGRWHYSSRRFRSGRTSSHYFLRALMSAQVTGSYRRRREARSDQGEVWDEVSRKLRQMRSHSSTTALHQVFQDHEKRLRTVLDRVPAPAGASGAVFAFGGRVAGAELFDRPETLSRLWPKILRSYAIDALEVRDRSPAGVTTSEVREWLSRAGAARSESYGSPGLGSDLRIESAELVGASLVVDDQPVHTELFRAVRP